VKPRYFTHDFDAGRDQKILKMRSDKWGSKGVGLYWLTVEYLFSVDGKARLDELKLAATHIGESAAVVDKFIHSCISKYELFDSDGESFWSNRLISELENAKRKSKRAQKNALKRYSTKNINSNSGYELSSNHTKPQRSHSSAKERRKEKKEEKDIYGEFFNVFLSISEYEKCVQKRGAQLTKDAIEYLSSYKASDGKSYKSDYAVLCRWVFDAVDKRRSGNSAATPFEPRVQKSVWDDEEFDMEDLL
jgi:hypothetical protein